MGLDGTKATASRTTPLPRAPAGTASVSAGPRRAALAGHDVEIAQAPEPRRPSGPRDALRRFVDAVRCLPERAASALQQAAHRAWTFPRHLATPARTDRFVMRCHVDRQLEALSALAALPRGAAASERRRLSHDLLDATHALGLDAARVDAHGRLRSGRDAGDLCKARIEARLASVPLTQLLALLHVLDERDELAFDAADMRTPADAAAARAALGRLREVANRLAYGHVVNQGLAATRHAWELFRREFSGRPESAALDCAGLARTLAAAVSTDHALEAGHLSTPPGHDPNRCLDIVREGLLALGTSRLVGVLQRASTEVLATLSDLFRDTRQDTAAGEMQAAVQREIDSHARQQLDQLARGCDEMSARLQRSGAGPTPELPGRRFSEVERPRADAPPEALDPARTLLAFGRYAGLLDAVPHHCAMCQIALPESFTPLRERVRAQLRLLLEQPQLLVAHATAAQLAQLRQLARKLDVGDPADVLAARADALVGEAAQAVEASFATLAGVLAGEPADAAAALRQAHAAAMALGDLEDVRARLAHESGDPARAAMARVVDRLDSGRAAAALAALGAQGGGVLDPMALRSAADSDAAPAGAVGRLLRATARVLDDLGALLRARVGSAASDAGGTPSGSEADGGPRASSSATLAFRELFGFDPPDGPVADGLSSGIFGQSFVEGFADKLESGMTESETKTLTIEGVVVPAQFHADAKRADKSTGMGTQFFLPGGQRLVDLDRNLGPLEDEEVDHRVRESFERLVSFYDGNVERARAVAALANQGISAAFLQGMLFCSNEDNPFSVNGVTGTINHEGDFKAARMAVNITFDKTAEGLPLVHVDYSLDGGRIDDLDGRSVLLDPERSRVHMRCSAVLEETPGADSGITLDGRIANRGRLRMLGKPHYSAQLVPRRYQRPYPEPTRVADLKPLRIHPDAVDGQERPEQTLRRSNMNRHLSQARDELMAVAHAGQDLASGRARGPATAEALFAIWALPPLAGAAQVESTLAALERAREPGAPPADAAALAPLRERVAAARLGILAALDEAGAAVDARLAQAYTAWRGEGESSTQSRPADYATLLAEFEAGKPGAAGVLDAFRQAVDAHAPELRRFRRALDELRIAPSFAKARELLKQEFAEFDPDGALRHRVQRLVDQLDSPDIDTRPFEAHEASLAAALEPALAAMVGNVCSQTSFSPT